MMVPVYRFAPSPNGYLHLGHALSALLNADLAKATGGWCLLRIEDIDPERSRPAFETAIYEDLRWLGLSWPRPARRQSDHILTYSAALNRLRDGGMLYPCFCTRSEVRADVTSQGPKWPHDPDGAPVYTGLCRGIAPHEVRRRLDNGDARVWRLDMAKACAAVGALTWKEVSDDGTVREVEATPDLWGDVIIARRDVPTSYHLSVVMDDAVQKVTHVVRGRDLYASTSVHRVLQALLGLAQPFYHHHRLILDEEGRKLSKSIGSAGLRHLRQQGATPADIRQRIGLRERAVA